MFKKVFVTGLLAVVLFVITPKEAHAQQTFKVAGRNCIEAYVGTRSSESNWYFDDLKFSNLYGGGDPAVVTVYYVNPDIYTGNLKEGAKMSLADLNKNFKEKGVVYSIKLSSYHTMEVTGYETWGGIHGNIWWQVKGPADILVQPGTLTFQEGHEVKVYSDQELFDRTFAEDYVTRVVLPLINYDKVKAAVDDIKKVFYDYAVKTGRKDQCPYDIGCLCGGDIAKHLKFEKTITMGGLGALTGVFPDGVDMLADSVASRITLQAQGILTCSLGYYYGHYPTKKVYDSRIKTDAKIVFADANFPKAEAVWAMKAEERTKIVQQASSLVKDVAIENMPLSSSLSGFTNTVLYLIGKIPVFGTAIAAGASGVLNAKDVAAIADSADAYYSPKYLSVPSNTTVTFQTAKVASTSSGGYLTVNSAGTTPVLGTKGGTGFDPGMVFKIIEVYESFKKTGWYRIQTSDGKYLRAMPPYSSTSSLRVEDFVNDDTYSYRFRFEVAGDGVDQTVYIRSAIDTADLKFRYIHTDANKSSNGTAAVLWDGWGGTNTKWRLRVASAVPVPNPPSDEDVRWSDSNAGTQTASGGAWKAVDVSSIFGTAYIGGIAYGNGRWVAVGGGGKMAYSDNGASWTAVSNSTFGTSNIHRVAYGNGRWIAVGRDGKMAYSDNGASWTAVADTKLGRAWFQWIAYGNGRWVAVANGGKMAYSDDNGVTWTAVPNTTGFSHIMGAAYANGRWIAVGHNTRMAYSADGASWTAIPAEKTFYRQINAIAYGNGRWVAVAEKGQMAYSDNNGASWTAIPPGKENGTTSTFGSSDIVSIAYDNNRWVAVGVGGQMAYSVDGVKWTAVANTTFGRTTVSGIAYGNGRWVAVGNNGNIAYSDD